MMRILRATMRLQTMMERQATMTGMVNNMMYITEIKRIYVDKRYIFLSDDFPTYMKKLVIFGVEIFKLLYNVYI